MRHLLESRYELRDISELSEYLGISIVRNRSTRSLMLGQPALRSKDSHIVSSLGL